MDKYSIVRVLGEGAFGKVLLATNKEEGNAKVAVKEIKNQFKNWDECVKLRELKALKLLRHVRIVRLKEMVLENQCLYFVFEFMDSNLADVLAIRKQKKQGPMPLIDIQRCMYSLVEGLCFMHKMGLFHRDIKPDNLLCNCDGRNIKIADFGLARELRARPPYTEYVSTRWYRAPEVILCDHAYSSPVDIWACGCILPELFSLSPLFPGTSAGDQMSRIVNLVGEPTPSRWPEGVRLASACHMRIPRTNPCSYADVLNPYMGSLSSSERTWTLQLTECMLELDPSKRPSAAQVLQFNFFSRFDPSEDTTSDQSPEKRNTEPVRDDKQKRSNSSRVNDSSNGRGDRGSGGGSGGQVMERAPSKASQESFMQSSPSAGIEDDIDELLGDLGFPVSPVPKSTQKLPNIKAAQVEANDADTSFDSQRAGVRQPVMLKSKSSLDEILCSLDAEFHSPGHEPTEGDDLAVDFDEEEETPAKSNQPLSIPSISKPSGGSMSVPSPIFTDTAKASPTPLPTSEEEAPSHISLESHTPKSITKSKSPSTPKPFTEQELAALVSAVELFPIAAGLDRNVRWKKIAHHVGNGRSKKECFEAFRDHCVNAKEKKKKKELERHASFNSASAEESLGQSKTAALKLREGRKEAVRRSEQFPPPNHQPANQTTPPEQPLVVESFD